MRLSQEQLERRAVLELRAFDRKLEGYAAKFNVEARIADFTELIRAGAFAESLRTGRDILALVDHDATRILARTRSQTLSFPKIPAACNSNFQFRTRRPAAMFWHSPSVATWAE